MYLPQIRARHNFGKMFALPAYHAPITANLLSLFARLGNGLYRSSVRLLENRATGALYALKSVPLEEHETVDQLIVAVEDVKSLSHVRPLHFLTGRRSI